MKRIAALLIILLVIVQPVAAQDAITAFYLPLVAFTDTPPTVDTGRPDVLGWNFAPIAVNPSQSDQTITFTAHFRDDLSGITDGMVGGIGVSPTQARFHSPSYHQRIDVLFYGPADLISGTLQDGVFQANLIVPRYSEAGTWRLEYLSITDDTGKFAIYNEKAAAAMGMPTTFEVTH